LKYNEIINQLNNIMNWYNTNICSNIFVYLIIIIKY